MEVIQSIETMDKTLKIVLTKWLKDQLDQVKIKTKKTKK